MNESSNDWLIVDQRSNLDSDCELNQLIAWCQLWHLPTGFTYHLTCKALQLEPRIVWELQKWTPEMKAAGKHSLGDKIVDSAAIMKFANIAGISTWLSVMTVAFRDCYPDSNCSIPIKPDPVPQESVDK